MSERYKLSEEEMKNKMINMTHEERCHSVQLGLYWVCSVLDETNMNPEEENIQTLLDVLFDIKGNLVEE